MNAVDTNVLVRFLVADNKSQFQAADRLMREGRVYIATTVMLETEWVLRRLYGRSTEQVGRALSAISGLPNVTLEHPSRIADALAAAGRGLDFADALHLAAAEACEMFLTFDQKLARRARSPVPVKLLDT